MRLRGFRFRVSGFGLNARTKTMNYRAASCGASKNRIYPKVVAPECFYRGSTMLTTTLSHVEWVGGPVRTSALDSRRFENLTVPREIEG